ncbi:hypothetical protein PIROE2DRAFT_18930 [Piromyces sp. E2]|nr:hypothetical protein PIROE2DRAFT_18930 [Piromyces sp. E2]|eukprot:OUM56463.1 hypothetical protein PIROE2DRAFT_18930 [Piromyces sp. E2]
MGSNIDNMVSTDLIFFTLEMNDPGAKYLGQTTNYCFGTECVLPSFKGKYSPFENNIYPLKINIKECNTTIYKYGHRESNYIKSCYIPVCELSCNSGECVSDNFCNCENTGYIGKTCSEREKLKRLKAYDIIIIIISSLLIGLSILLIGRVLFYKTDVVIKVGGN